jgi:molybdopterin/thiamine biosynthesis adenylyltransferase/proteasome lid subunit RPN8/RPN11
VRTTLTLTEEMWAELTSALDEPRETAGFLLAGFARSADDLTLLGRTLGWVPEEHYLMRTPKQVKLSSAGFVPFLAAAAKDKSTPVLVHTHPGGAAAPSTRDAKVDRDLCEPALRRSGQPFYTSLIIAGTTRRPSFTGIVYGPDGKIGTLERIRIVGRRIHIIGAADHTKATVNFDAFDRQIRAFGKGGQRLIARLRVGIVGAGGTGSAVFEQLVRLGVGEIVLIDDDTVSKTNVTRIHESAISQSGKLKIDVAKEAAGRIGLGTTVRTVEGRISDKAVARALRHCDVVFGCTDDETGRQQLSRLALWYLIPVFDMGFLVSSTPKGGIAGLYGRVTSVMPGAACLVCRDYATPEGLHAEALPADEREARAQEGYVPGLRERDPSVGVFTTMVATFAINELLDRLIGYSAPPGAGSTETLIRLHERKLGFNSKPPRGNHWCGNRSNWGRGDAPSFLGYRQ